ncbi:hypothetical protein AVEN_269432-1 [Araneus ventricosus]|uniref:Uncharacterized protein n=1 Tax=Araneus ventricosus TaxID=182803 RepID=A0A4Y2JEP7_ARAVE|nr:hypothetical protein AVEN_269432-1 [Araneus ventricosus]
MLLVIANQAKKRCERVIMERGATNREILSSDLLIRAEINLHSSDHRIFFSEQRTDEGNRFSVAPDWRATDRMIRKKEKSNATPIFGSGRNMCSHLVW